MSLEELLLEVGDPSEGVERLERFVEGEKLPTEVIPKEPLPDSPPGEVSRVPISPTLLRDLEFTLDTPKELLNPDLTSAVARDLAPPSATIPLEDQRIRGKGELSMMELFKVDHIAASRRYKQPEWLTPDDLRRQVPDFETAHQLLLTVAPTEEDYHEEVESLFEEAKEIGPIAYREIASQFGLGFQSPLSAKESREKGYLTSSMMKPVVGTFEQFLDNKEMRDLSIKLAETPSYKGREKDEKELIEWLNKKYELSVRGQTIGAMFQQGLAQMPKWMIDFWLSGEAAKLLLGGRFLGAAEDVSKLGKGALLWNMTLNSLVRAGFSPHLVASSFMERELQNINASIEDGKLSVEFRRQNPYMTALKSYGDVAVSMFAEQSGRFISRLPGIRQLESLWMAKTGGTVADFARLIGTNVGFNGMLGEIGEERLEEIMRPLLGLGEFTLPSWKQVQAELLTFAVPTSLGLGGRLAFGKRAKMKRLGPREGGPQAAVVARREGLGPARAARPGLGQRPSTQEFTRDEGPISPTREAGLGPSRAGLEVTEAGLGPHRASLEPSKAGLEPARAGRGPAEAGKGPRKAAGIKEALERPKLLEKPKEEKPKVSPVEKKLPLRAPKEPPEVEAERVFNEGFDQTRADKRALEIREESGEEAEKAFREKFLDLRQAEAEKAKPPTKEQALTVGSPTPAIEVPSEVVSDKASVRAGLVSFLEEGAKERERKKLGPQARAYRRAAELMRSLETVPTEAKDLQKLKGIGPKLSKVIADHLQGREVSRETSARSSELRERVPESVERPKLALADEGAGKETTRYKETLAKRREEGEKTRFRVGHKIYFNMDDLVGRVETVSGVEGALAAELRVESAAKYADKMADDLGKSFVDANTDLTRLSERDAKLAVAYMTSGKKPEGISDDVAKAVEILRDFDNAPLGAKYMIKSLRVDRFAISNNDKGFTEKQRGLLEPFRELYRRSPQAYYKAVKSFAQSEKSDPLIIENYFVRRWKTSLKIESIEVDYQREKSGSPGTIFSSSLQARQAKKAIVEGVDNPLLDMFRHDLALIRAFHMTRHVDFLWNKISPHLEVQSKQQMKEALRRISGISPPRSTLSVEIQKTMSNAFKAFAALRALPLKNPFQKFLALGATRGRDSVRLTNVKGVKAFRKKWGPRIADKVEVEVLQRRAILRDIYSLGLDQIPWRDLGMSAKAVRLLGNNVVIRSMNRVLADQMATLHAVFLDSRNRRAVMDRWMTIGKRELITEGKSWAKARRKMGQTFLSRPEQAIIADLVSQGRLEDAIFQNAKFITDHTQFKYDLNLRNIWGQSPGGRALYQFAVWWRGYSMLYYRTLSNLSKSGLRVSSALTTAKFLGIAAVGGTIYSAMTGRLQPGRDWMERLWNTASEVLNPFSWEGVGGPNTVLTPVNIIRKLAGGDAPSQIIGEGKSFLQGLTLGGEILAALYKSEELDDEQMKFAKKKFDQMVEIGDKYLNTFYWGYRQVAITLDAIGDTWRANQLMKLLKEFVGIDYKPQTQRRTTLEKIWKISFAKNVVVSDKMQREWMIRASNTNLTRRERMRAAEKLLTSNISKEEALKRLESHGQEILEPERGVRRREKRRWGPREILKRSSWLRGAFDDYDSYRKEPRK